MGRRVTLSRRGFLRSTGLAGAATLTGLQLATALADSEAPGITRPVGEPEVIARDESFWRKGRGLYDVDTEITNLENGYWGMMPRHLMAEYEAHTESVNRANASYARKQFYVDYRGYRQRAAAELTAMAPHSDDDA